jgi:hypothetical protein
MRQGGGGKLVVGKIRFIGDCKGDDGDGLKVYRHKGEAVCIYT